MGIESFWSGSGSNSELCIPYMFDALATYSNNCQGCHCDNALNLILESAAALTTVAVCY